jgi:hypothetical protein
MKEQVENDDSTLSIVEQTRPLQLIAIPWHARPLRKLRRLLTITNALPLLFTRHHMKISHVAILALALPLALAAQQTPAGPQANPITAAFRGRTLGLQRNLAQAFDSIPESKFGYKPTPSQLSIGYIAQHVASDNYLFCNNFGAMKATLPATDTTIADSIKAKWPKDTLVAKLKASLTFCENAFAQLDDSKLAEPISLTFNGQTRNSTRVVMVLGHALDIADHYSQLANYMRLNNILPPTALPRPGRGGN